MTLIEGEERVSIRKCSLAKTARDHLAFGTFIPVEYGAVTDGTKDLPLALLRPDLVKGKLETLKRLSIKDPFGEEAIYLEEYELTVKYLKSIEKLPEGFE